MSMIDSTMEGYGVIGRKINDIRLSDINQYIAENNIDPYDIYECNDENYYGDTGTTIYDYYAETEDNQLEILTNLINKVCEINNIEIIDFDGGCDSDGDCYILYTPKYPWHKMDRSLTEEDIQYVLKLTAKACGIILDDSDIDYQTARFWG